MGKTNRRESMHIFIICMRSLKFKVNTIERDWKYYKIEIFSTAAARGLLVNLFDGETSLLATELNNLEHIKMR